MKTLKKLAKLGLLLPEVIIMFVTLLGCFLIKSRKDSIRNLKVVLGSDPLINNVYWRDSIRQFAHANTYTTKLYPTHNRGEWDVVYDEKFKYLPSPLRSTLAFCEVLLKYDVLITSFRGFAIDDKPFWKLQAYLLHGAKIKIIVIPYGSDAYNYGSVASPMLKNALIKQYPHYSREAYKIQKRLNYWSKNADFIIPGVMGFDGLSRWDLLTCSPLVIDTKFWKKDNQEVNEKHKAEKSGVVVGHFPNHRIVKGSDFLEAAVKILQNEGIKISVLELTGKSKKTIRDAMIHHIDILFDQINFIGYALTAIEGMACNLPVIANLTDQRYMDVFLFNSFLSECPIVSVNHRTLIDELRTLALDETKRQQLGEKGRAYAEKYHSIHAGTSLFCEVFNRIMNNSRSMQEYRRSELEDILKTFKNGGN